MDKSAEENITVSTYSFANLDKNVQMNQLKTVAEKTFENLCEEKVIKVKILVVDDSLSIRLFLQDELTKEGYEVATAENGEIALDIVKTSRPDLILSDVYMPKMSGIELCKVLHLDPLYSKIPFVVMSTENDRNNMTQMTRHGAAAFIIKPFNIEQLLMTLNKRNYSHLLKKVKKVLTGF